MMYNRLYKFLVESNILYQKQFGFQNARSTEHAILQLVNQITEAFSQGRYYLVCGFLWTFLRHLVKLIIIFY